MLVIALGVYWVSLPPTLSVDPGCRNDIRLKHVSGTWINGGPVPEEWKDRGSVEGTFDRTSDTEGIFRAEGFEVQLFEGNATAAVCSAWPSDVPSEG